MNEIELIITEFTVLLSQTQGYIAITTRYN